MEQKDQVCSFDQAALIYSFGVRFDNTLFQWSQHKKTGENRIFPSDINPIDYDWVYLFPAYSVAELMGMLPDKMDDLPFRVGKSKRSYFCYFWSQSRYMYFENKCFYGKTSAVSLAKMLIWLIENKHLKPEDLKL